MNASVVTLPCLYRWVGGHRSRTKPGWCCELWTLTRPSLRQGSPHIVLISLRFPRTLQISYNLWKLAQFHYKSFITSPMQEMSRGCTQCTFPTNRHGAGCINCILVFFSECDVWQTKTASRKWKKLTSDMVVITGITWAPNKKGISEYTWNPPFHPTTDMFYSFVPSYFFLSEMDMNYFALPSRRVVHS